MISPCPTRINRLSLLAVLAMALPGTAQQAVVPDSAATPRLEAWQNLRHGIFLHFGMSTFTGNEFDPGDAPSSTYAPEDPDPDQWLEAAAAAGMKYAVLTSKHVAGHCLWDSKVIFRGKEFDYDVATSGNREDVVQSFVDACQRHGIQPGLYYCLLDFRNNPMENSHQWGAYQLPEEYHQLVRAQLAELAAKYPAVKYWWLDIPRAASREQRAGLYDLLRRASPDSVVLFNYGLRQWKPEEKFTIDLAARHVWPTDILNSERDPILTRFESTQTFEGKSWSVGYEHCDTAGKHWFWAPDDAARPIEVLLDLQEKAVLRGGGNFLLNYGPDKSGKLADWQLASLRALKDRLTAPVSRP